jgi:transcriptional regulator
MSREEGARSVAMDLLQGTLALLILKTLQQGPRHGWDIAQRIQQVSQEVLRVGQGSLYPALYRLENRGLISAEWGASENNRKASSTGSPPAEGNSWRRKPRDGNASPGRWRSS